VAKKAWDGPSLFDDPPPAAPTFNDAFVEVPHHIYVSWSLRQKLAYCAARDRNSALEAESDEEFAFFIERADSYDMMAKECK
jgi:hypothetical protein